MSPLNVDQLAQLARDSGALDVEGDGEEIIFEPANLRMFAAQLFEIAAGRPWNVVQLHKGAQR